MSYRYRDHACGITARSLMAARRNLHKVGDVKEIRGYRFTSTRFAGFTNPLTTDHESVMIVGTKGTARFEGVLWGYAGTGPNGLVQILQACGLNQAAAMKIAYGTHRRSTDGIDWSIKFPVPVPTLPELINA